MSDKFNTIKKLTFLEHYSYNPVYKSLDALPDILVKTVWNLSLRHYYKVGAVEFSPKDVKELTQLAQNAQYPLPSFFMYLVDTYGWKHYNTAFKHSNHIRFDFFLVDVIEYFGHTSRLNKYPPETIAWFQEATVVKDSTHNISLPRIMQALWQQTSLDKKTFDISTTQGLWAWTGFFSRYVLPRIGNYTHPDWFMEFLNKPAVAFSDESCIPNYLWGIWLAEPDLQARFDLQTTKGVLGWIGFFYRWIAPQLQGYLTPQWLQEYLDKPASFPFAAEIGLSNIIAAVHASEPDFNKQFPLTDKDAARNFVMFFFTGIVQHMSHYRNPEWMKPFFLAAEGTDHGTY